MAKQIIKRDKKVAKVKVIDGVNGLESEVNQKPSALFVNISANGPGFDQAQFDIIKTFVENTTEPHLIIPSSKDVLKTLDIMDPGKKQLRNYLESEVAAKRIKISYLFTNKEFSADSIAWTRDYAPIKIYNGKKKKFELIAFKYRKATVKDQSGYNSGMRYIEDAQERVAKILKLDLMRSDLYAEGGNMLASGSGNVYISTALIDNNPLKTKLEIEEELIRLGLGNKIVWITKLPRKLEPTGHVDLIMRFIDDRRVIVPSSSNKSLNSALNKVVKELEESGL
ncbi:MAG: agmatine deiminase family protein, partial [Bdellovibrionales bacterium]|nr:agmatine deiminase family protein [Bdellovibrionales bacterium]